jgi:hypothetical protein
MRHVGGHRRPQCDQTPTGSNGLRRKQPQRDRPIILAAKLTGKRSAGNPHASFDEAGAENITTTAGMRPSAKVLDSPPESTVVRQSSTLLRGCLQQVEEQRRLQALTTRSSSTRISKSK